MDVVGSDTSKLYVFYPCMQTQAERSKEDGTDKQNEDSCHSSLTPEAIRDFFLEYHREKEEKKYVHTCMSGV